MSLPMWPEELGAPLLEGSQLTREDNRLFGGGQSGPPRVRRRASRAAKSAAFSFYMTDDQRAKFGRFFEEETAEGTLPFAMPAWGETDKPLLTTTGEPILTENGQQLLLIKNWLCLFGQSMPSVVPMGVGWRISFDLVILP